MESKVVMITPSMAKLFLEKNTGNRHLRKNVVAAYAEQMKAGVWDVTHQGIAFGIGGVLIDGSHRLNAVIQYGKPVKMLVTTGLPYDSALNVNIDRGIARSNSDILGETKKTVQVANFLCKLVHGSNAVKNTKLVASFLDVFKPFIERIEDTCKSNVRVRSSVPIRSAVCIRSIENDEVLKQYKAFVRIDADIMWPSVVSLLKQSCVPDSHIGYDQYGMTARAWVAFDERRKEVSRIQIKKHDAVLREIKKTIISLIS